MDRVTSRQFELSANTIAKVYKDRWQIELLLQGPQATAQSEELCRYLKKRSAVPIVGYPITYLLLCYLKFKSRFCWSLYILSSILPTNLFARRNLWDWLNAPYHAQSNKPPRTLQYTLSFI
jgi:hypothetical protein